MSARPAAPRAVPLAGLRFADLLRPGDTVGWPQGPGEPLALTEALVAQGASLPRPTLFYGLTSSDTLRPELAAHFGFLGLNGAGTSRRVSALADIVPAHVSTVPALLRDGLLRVDVALVAARPLPDGRWTTGVVSDFTQALVRQARTVVALLNPALPALADDAAIDAAEIDVLVEAPGDVRIADMPDPEPSEVEQAVARQVAALVPDRATIELGIGTLPVAVARALLGHQGLGVHTGVVSDVLVELVERGVVTNAHKGRDAGLTVTGGLFGTGRLRAFAQRPGTVSMRSTEYTHSPIVAAALYRFHTINSAIETDLGGQLNAEVAGGRYLGAVGGLPDFVRCGNASPGGRSIIAFPSTTPDGRHSRIVASLEGRPVTTARADVDAIVTEHGVAHLRGCGLAERARRLVAIAHPAHREALERALHAHRGEPPLAGGAA
jgi:acetyl-CoA hydrolase